MGKKAFIVVRLVPEAKVTGNERIEKEIREESFIPYSAEIERVTIEEAENPYKTLREHRFSKKVARNIVKFYEG